MAKTPKDPQAIEFQLRTGTVPFGPLGWRGVNTMANPGSLQPNELQRGENIRLSGGDILARPGLQQLIDLGLGPSNSDNPIQWMHEAPVDNPRIRLWASALGCFGVGVGTGSTLYHLDETEAPAFQSYSQTLTGSDFQACMAVYGDKLFVGDRTMLREVVTATTPPNVSSAALFFSPPNSPSAVFAGFTIRCMQAFDGKLFIGLENTADPALSKIAVWNGVYARDDITGIRPPLAMALYKDKLVVGFDAGAAHVRVRNPGAAPGTWNTFALAGFLCAAQGNAMVEHRQYLYIASGTDLLHRFDGAALSLVRTVAGCATDGLGLTALAEHRGLLYYGWNTPSATYASRIGRHDLDSTATPYTDTYKDITTAVPNFKGLSSLASHSQRLIMGGQYLYLVGTADNDVQGVSVTLNGTGAPGAGFFIKQLLRFPAQA